MVHVSVDSRAITAKSGAAGDVEIYGAGRGVLTPILHLEIGIHLYAQVGLGSKHFLHKGIHQSNRSG
jgi:hypothetical protein